MSVFQTLVKGLKGNYLALRSEKFLKPLCKIHLKYVGDHKYFSERFYVDEVKPSPVVWKELSTTTPQVTRTDR